MIWEFNRIKYRHILGEELFSLWEAIVLNNNYIKTPCLQLLTTTTRNSGEMDTSEGNTDLSRHIWMWAMEKVNFKGDYWLLVEGDDSHIILRMLATDNEIEAIIKAGKSLGFGITIDYIGPPAGSTFV